MMIWGKCNLGINTIVSLLIVQTSCNAYNAYYSSIYSNNNNLTKVLMCATAHMVLPVKCVQLQYGIAC